ncbi:MAG: hypothetical protein MI976_30170 [Pseudomonadales bacterium]|nr:hypothetical protein [Pseudomonadales bacterium]
MGVLWGSFLPLFLLVSLITFSSASVADIVVVVNENNPVVELNENQVKQLFLGRMRNFPGVKSDVEIVELEPSAPIFNAFYQHIIQRDAAWIKRYRARYYFSGQGRLPVTLKTESDIIAYTKLHRGVAAYIQLEASEPIPSGLKEVHRISTYTSE